MHKIMRKNAFRTTAAAAALVGLTALAGCSTNNNNHSGMPMGNDSASSSPSVSSTATAGAHNSQDLMFAQMMIPHHQQAIEMSDLILAKDGIDPRVTKLARQIKAAQAPEISTMRGWLISWGADPSPSPMDHGDMGGMGGGMMSPVEMLKLKNADGDQAARLFLTGMIGHHRGAIAMAKTETDRGQNTDTKKLAASIRTSQRAEISTMQKLLAGI